MHTLDDGCQQAKRGDVRLTRVGAWLQRRNIDEIPQLFNVLTGDMSLVGPRPHPLPLDEDYQRRISLYARRHNVKPGITGSAQIHGYRGETDTDEKMHNRIKYDLSYIDNWSLWLDLKIIVRTVLSRTAYQNAYSAAPRPRRSRLRFYFSVENEKWPGKPGHLRLLNCLELADQRRDSEHRADGDQHRRKPQHADQQPNRTRLWHRRGSGVGPRFHGRIGPAERSGRLFDSGDVALKLGPVRGRHRVGGVDDRLRDNPRDVVRADILKHGASCRAVGREKTECCSDITCILLV